MSAPSQVDNSIVAQSDMSTTPTELVVHVDTTGPRTNLALSVTSAQHKDTRAQFYNWKQPVMLSDDFKALQGKEEELKTFIEEKLRASDHFGSGSFATSVVLNPQQTDLERTSIGIQLEGSNRFVDITITPQRPENRLETGEIQFLIGSPHLAVPNEVSAEISATVGPILRERYFRPGSVRSVLESEAKGSTLREKLRDELSTMVENIYMERGWDHNNSLIVYEMRRLVDQEVDTTNIRPGPISADKEADT